MSPGLPSRHPDLLTVGLLTLSNVLMTLARYGHLNRMRSRTWVDVALVRSRISGFASLLWVPAHGNGFARGPTLAQRKAGQETITPIVVEAFAWLYAKQPTRLDDRWAALCRLRLACRALRA